MAIASIFKKYSDRSLTERSAAIPVFIITNEHMSPYLSPRGAQVKVFMFLDPRDAEACLREMRQTSSGAAEDAHITCISFDRAYNQARGGPRPTGSKARLGGEIMMEYVFSPSSRDAAHVKKLGVSKKGQLVKPPSLPGFECEGLTIKRDGVPIRPVFLSRRDLEAAWKEERTVNPRMPEKPPNVQVVDVLALCLALENDDGSFPVPGVRTELKVLQPIAIMTPFLYRKCRRLSFLSNCYLNLTQLPNKCSYFSCCASNYGCSGLRHCA